MKEINVLPGQYITFYYEGDEPNKMRRGTVDRMRNPNIITIFDLDARHHKSYQLRKMSKLSFQG